MNKFSPLVVLLSFLYFISTCQGLNMTVGFLMPSYYKSFTEGAYFGAHVAIKVFEKQAEGQNLLSDLNFTFARVDSQVNELVSLTAINAYRDMGAAAIIGEIFTAITKHVGLAASVYKIPICSGATSGVEMSNSLIYPYFLRTIPDDSTQSTAIVDYIYAMGWKKIAIMASTGARGQSLQIKTQKKAFEKNITIVTAPSYKMADVGENITDPSLYSDALTIVKQSKAKVILILADKPESALEILKGAKKIGIFGDEYVYIATALALTLLDHKTEPLYNGIIYTQAMEDGDEEAYQTFSEEWDKLVLETGNQQSRAMYSAFYHDCMLSFLHAYNNLLKNNAGNPEFTLENLANGSLSKYLNHSVFESQNIKGASGDLVIKKGDRNGYFGVYNRLNDGRTVRVAKWFNTLTFELNTTFSSGSQVIPRDTDPEFYVPWNSASSAFILVVASIVILIDVVVLILLVIFRKHQAVVTSSFHFCILIIVGSILAAASVLTLIGYPTRHSCLARPWAFAISYALIFANLTGKTWRIYKIFHIKDFKILALTNLELFVYNSSALVVEIILLIIWSTYDPPMPKASEMNGVSTIMCKSKNEKFGNGMGWSLIAFNITITVLGAFMAFRTRNVPSEYRESNYIGLSLYNILVLSVVVLPILTVSGTGPEVQFIILSLGICLVALITIVILFVPKLLAIYGVIRSNHNTKNSVSSSHKNSFTGSSAHNNNNILVNKSSLATNSLALGIVLEDSN